MSDSAAATSISIVEINGRIAEIESQRDAALARASKFAGEKAELIDLIQILKKENERLDAVVKRQSELLPPEIDRDGAADAEPMHQTH